MHKFNDFNILTKEFIKKLAEFEHLTCARLTIKTWTYWLEIIVYYIMWDSCKCGSITKNEKTLPFSAVNFIFKH